MAGFTTRARRRGLTGAGILCFALLLCACSHTTAKAPGATTGEAPTGATTGQAATGATTGKTPTGISRPIRDVDIEDVRRIPQRFAEITQAAGDRLSIDASCRGQLLDEFTRRYFNPWTTSAPLFDLTESGDFMKKEAQGNWYGVNKRKIPTNQLQELLVNCDLDSFPSRNDTAIAVAPGHLRGLPTPLPIYERADGAPFDMLSYPQVKLNEPLRVLHVSRDGAWLFVETAYSNGWLESRDVALVDDDFIESWMQAPRLVIVRDFAAVPDGSGVATSRAKIGTVLPLVLAGEGWWDVKVASVGEGGEAQTRSSRIPADAAAPFPLEFNKENIAMIGDQLLGQPYGWGEIYDLRDCSALLRDFFLPFGIWLPRTSADQIASVHRRTKLAALAPQEKEKQITSKALPFLSLLYKPGHIMLYAGVDREGRALVFHNAWSIRLKDGDGERTQIIGATSITTLEPGKELGLVPGGSLLERATELATVTDRCAEGAK